MKTLNTIILFLLFTTLIHSQTEWFKYPLNPVLAGGPDDWDLVHTAFSSVIFHEGIYKMWYLGGRTTISNVHIGYATSVDGLSWQKHPDNPVLSPTPGTFDAGGVGTCSVIFDEGIYKMWYLGLASHVNDIWRIGYATSTDGIIWQKDTFNNPVLDIGSQDEWDDFQVGHPTVIREGPQLKMWYRGGHLSGSQGNIGYATSPDGINWTKYNDPLTSSAPYAESDPVLITGSPGSWDDIYVAQPNVIYNSATLTYEMWYIAQGNLLGQNIGYATSPDGIIWTKFDDPLTNAAPFAESDPVMIIDSTNKFDNIFLLAPCVILENDQIYKMWYTGFGGSPQRWRIGHASTDPTVDVEDEYYSLPQYFYLSQNYPNPFNPSTTISWQSPVGSHQTLKVYDLLGREVATLVDEFKPAGSYEVEFDASNLSSGIYIYRFQAGKYFDAKKLILLK